MFGHVVAVFFFVWGPVVLKLALSFSVVESMVFYVHCFQFFDDVVVDGAQCSSVVCLQWCWRLGMAHEFKCMAGGDGLSAVYVEMPHLSLGCQGHDSLDNLCKCEDGAIIWWFGNVVGHEEMCARLEACL